jgi:hypothetical protein
MRTLAILLTLLAIHAEAADRTWTIARDVYTAEAELIAVRGELVYLKIDGRVEEIPLARLSAADQEFIGSLSLAPITPGPAVESANYSEEMPLPGEPDPAPVDLEMNTPDLAPAYGGAQFPQSTQPQRAYRMNPYGGAMPPQSGVRANYYAPQGNWGENAANADRRYRRPPQQGPNNQADRRRGEETDEAPGVLGFRARRLERERAAASRAR